MSFKLSPTAEEPGWRIIRLHLVIYIIYHEKKIMGTVRYCNELGLELARRCILSTLNLILG